MNTSHGWVKLYRCLLDDAVCQKSAYFHLWVTLLLMAAHKEHEFIFNNRIQKLKPGQLITGHNKLSKLTGIHESTIHRALKCLEIEQMIEPGRFTRPTRPRPTAVALRSNASCTRATAATGCGRSSPAPLTAR
jgi:hypothetical protein